MWFDNHCHLASIGSRQGLTSDDVIAEAAKRGVTHFVTVGCDVADSATNIEIADRFDNVWATAGVHPHSAKDGTDGLAELVARSDVAVGECGLDYFYDNSPRDAQASVFEEQIALANRLGRTLVIHSRDAWDDTFAILRSEGAPERTVFHCFTGGEAEARRALELGAFLSFSGIVTFPNAEPIRAAAKLAPLDRIVVETDSPYLAPEPLRGQPNSPANVAIVGEFVASVKAVDIAEFAATTFANTLELFNLDLGSSLQTPSRDAH